MRVLQLPVNVASHLSTTVRSLQAAGVDARGLVFTGSSHVQSHDGVRVLARSPSRRDPRWWAEIAPRLGFVLDEIRRADVLHWYMQPGLPLALDLRAAAALRKPMVVEFAGGDIRKPSVEAAENPYYAAAEPHDEYRHWVSDEASTRRQRLFAAAGAEALVSCWSLLPYLDPGRFEPVHLVRQRIAVSDFEPEFPRVDNARPLVVHAATAPVSKGTAAVVAAIDALRERGVEFDALVLDRVPRDEALAAVRRCDVYLDQFVLGSHGSAAVEAMALGKPVVGWIKPSMVARYPADLPIVNASQDDLADVLEPLLRDGDRRHELGIRSRAYAERHHDADRLAHELVAVYEGVVARRRSPSR